MDMFFNLKEFDKERAEKLRKYLSKFFGTKMRVIIGQEWVIYEDDK